MKQQLRKCSCSKIVINEKGEQIKKDCPTKYKVHVCPVGNQKIIANVVMGADHEHDEEDE